MDTNKQEGLRVIFTPKADSVVLNILKNNGLQESEEEFFDKLEEDKEPRETIVKSAAATIARKKISENKLTELLQKHLKISSDVAQKIIIDIKNELLPFLKIYPDEKFDDPVFREKVSVEIFGIETGKDQIKKQTDELIGKIRNKNAPTIQTQEEGGDYDKEAYKRNLLDKIKTGKNPAPPKPTPPDSYVKKVPIVDVDKNAEDIKNTRQPIASQNTEETPKAKPQQPDKYKEAVE